MVLGKSHCKVRLIRTCWVNLIMCSTCHFLHMPLCPSTKLCVLPHQKPTYLVHWFSFSKPLTLSAASSYSNQTQSPAATASTAINLRTHFDGQIVTPTLTTVPLLLSSFCFVWQPATIFILLLSYRNCLRNLDKLKLYHISCFAIQTASPLFLFYTLFCLVWEFCRTLRRHSHCNWQRAVYCFLLLKFSRKI